MLLIALGLGYAQAQTWDIAPEFWLSPRGSDAVLHNAQLRAMATEYLRLPTARVRVHYQKRDEASAQAEELRSWLIALGIEADRIELLDDNPQAAIKLELMESR